MAPDQALQAPRCILGKLVLVVVLVIVVKHHVADVEVEWLPPRHLREESIDVLEIVLTRHLVSGLVGVHDSGKFWTMLVGRPAMSSGALAGISTRFIILVASWDSDAFTEGVRLRPPVLERGAMTGK